MKSQVLDILVIGGGVVGAGAALDAASRGLAVGIIEQSDWASGTSSRSSKLVHGGIRYLEQLNFKLVKEALVERGLLLRTIAPHLVKPVSFLYPVTKPLVERLYVGAGMALYDVFSYAGGRHPGVGLHRHLSRKRVRDELPGLNRATCRGGISYFDAQVDDARLVATIVRTAVSRGVHAMNRAGAVEIMPGTDGGNHAVLVSDEETGERFEVQARSIINATGVWTAESQAMLGVDPAVEVTMSKGIHILVNRDRFPSEMGLILRAGASVLFVIPWGNYWIIGTTDTPWELGKANPSATSADVQYLLDHVNKVLEVPIAHEDVLGVYAGLRPLVKGKAGSTAQLSREHVVDVPHEGIAVIAGGKLTTYRVMARDAVDAATRGRSAARPSHTLSLPLLGAEKFVSAEAESVCACMLETLGLPSSHAARLVGRYGNLAAEVLKPVAEDRVLGLEICGGGGALLAEALYAVTHEGALHLEDILDRRLRVSIESKDFGEEAASEVARVVAPALGWTAEDIADELERYQEWVRLQRGAMSLPDDISADAVMRRAMPAARAAARACS
jgi:glycerol-3-phosphate dehydrogenase